MRMTGSCPRISTGACAADPGALSVVLYGRQDAWGPGGGPAGAGRRIPRRSGAARRARGPAGTSAASRERLRRAPPAKAAAQARRSEPRLILFLRRKKKSIRVSIGGGGGVSKGASLALERPYTCLVLVIGFDRLDCAGSVKHIELFMSCENRMRPLILLAVFAGFPPFGARGLGLDLYECRTIDRVV